MRSGKPLAVDDITQHHHVPGARLGAAVEGIERPLDAGTSLLVVFLLAPEVDISENKNWFHDCQRIPH